MMKGIGRFSIQKGIGFVVHFILLFILVGCNLPPRVMAADRLFLDLKLEFLDVFEIPQQTFQKTLVGGLSALTYDRKRDRYYLLSDDRGRNAPAHFYTATISLSEPAPGKAKISNITLNNVTFLKNIEGKTFAPNTIDSEGIALSPRNTVFISSEGVPKQGIAPFIGEYELETGALIQNLRLPERFLASDDPQQPRGVNENVGFESLTVFPRQGQPIDPFRLFTLTESALKQDTDRSLSGQIPLRLLHYGINPIGEPILIAEHVYLLEPAPTGAVKNGVSDLLALDQDGYWLTLERHFGLFGFQAKIYQAIAAAGTDTSSNLAFQGNLGTITPIQKRLLLDLDSLGIELDNLEGMTLGPRLADGSQTLIVISDDNFRKDQKTQVLLFRLRDGKGSPRGS